MKLIADLLSSFDANIPNFRPTEIYNESWLVKLVMWQAAAVHDTDFPLGFLPGSTWFSEALLPTAFKARYRGDPLAESRTNADGVIGHFLIGKKAKADFELVDEPRQFTVVEAKIGSSLSKGTSNAKYFDQAARNIACMAEVIARANLEPSSFSRLDFILLAPEYAINADKFRQQMEQDSIHAKVEQRVAAYDGALDSWYMDHFEPTLHRIQLYSLSWEAVIQWIGRQKAWQAEALFDFYKLCLKYK